MCTVTVIPLPAGGFRVACNRDESRARVAALPPLLSWAGSVRAIMPIDPVAGGTWIAATDRGIVLALLNYNMKAERGAGDAASRSVPPASRGTIIPFLADCRDLSEVVARIGLLQAHRFGPFRLMIANVSEVVEYVSDGRTITRREGTHVARTPLLFTSSSLGDTIVEQPRRALFDAKLMRDANAEGQDLFHRHSWPDRPHLSVCMSRADAQTVSYTTVEILTTCATMRYWPAPPDMTAGVAATTRCISLIAKNGLLVPAGCA
jgi:hypothetical protein